MRAPLKILLGLAGFALLLFLVLVTVVMVVFEPEDYRGYIVSTIETTTGRSFELGALGLDVFPCCSLSLGPARLGNPRGFPDDRFASVQSVSASLRLWPLIVHREVRIGTVALDGVDVALVRLADGRVNWELSGEPAAEADPATPDSATPAIQVEGLRLSRVQLSFQDQASPAAYTALADLSTGRIDYNGERLTVQQPAVTLDAGGSGIPTGPLTADVSAEALALQLGGEASATVESLALRVTAPGAELSFTGGGRFGPTGGDAAGTFALAETSPRELLKAFMETPYRPADDTALSRLAAEGRWRLDGSTLAVEGLDVQLDDSRLTASATAEALGAGPVRVDVRVDGVDVGRYLPAADRGLETAPTEEARGLETAPAAADGLLVKDVEVRVERQGDEVTLRAGAEVLEGRVAAEGHGTLSGDAPQLAGTLQVTDLPPRRLLAALDAAPETADPAVLERLSGRADWRVTDHSLALRDMRWRLDDSELTGSLAIDDFATVATRFDLAVDRLNLDAYLPPEDAEADAAGEEAAQIPVALIRDLNLQGRLRAEELTAMGLTLRNAVAEARAADGVLRIDPLTADLYGGRYAGTVAVDATAPEAKLTLDQSLAAVQVDEIVESLFGSDALAGSLSLKLHGSGLGNTPADLLRGLAGEMSFDLSDGVYRGLDVVHELRRARATLKNAPVPETPARPETALRALSASGRLVDGVLQTHQLSADAGGLALAGQGGINLMELALDYQLDARLTETAAAAAKLSDLAGMTIPLAISGPLTSPKMSVDLQALVTDNLRGALERRARDALLDRLGGADASTDASTNASTGASTDGAGSATAPATPPPEPEASVKDLLKRGLRNLLKPSAEDG